MCCTLNLDVEILQNEKPLAYKYLVYNSQHQHSDDDEKSPYEFLHQTPSRIFGSSHIVNRCLVIPRDKCKAKGNVFSLQKKNGVYNLLLECSYREVPPI